MNADEICESIHSTLARTGKPARVYVEPPNTEGTQWEAVSLVGEGVITAQQVSRGDDAVEALRTLVTDLLHKGLTPLTADQRSRLEKLALDLSSELVMAAQSDQAPFGRAGKKSCRCLNPQPTYETWDEWSCDRKPKTPGCTDSITRREGSPPVPATCPGCGGPLTKKKKHLLTGNCGSCGGKLPLLQLRAAPCAPTRAQR